MFLSLLVGVGAITAAGVPAVDCTVASSAIALGTPKSTLVSKLGTPNREPLTACSELQSGDECLSWTVENSSQQRLVVSIRSKSVVGTNWTGDTCGQAPAAGAGSKKVNSDKDGYQKHLTLARKYIAANDSKAALSEVEKAEATRGGVGSQKELRKRHSCDAEGANPGHVPRARQTGRSGSVGVFQRLRIKPFRRVVRSFCDRKPSPPCGPRRNRLPLSQKEAGKGKSCRTHTSPHPDQYIQSRNTSNGAESNSIHRCPRPSESPREVPPVQRHVRLYLRCASLRILHLAT